VKVGGGGTDGPKGSLDASGAVRSSQFAVESCNNTATFFVGRLGVWQLRGIQVLGVAGWQGVACVVLRPAEQVISPHCLVPWC
jgi:hypothetical protein